MNRLLPCLGFALATAIFGVSQAQLPPEMSPPDPNPPRLPSDANPGRQLMPGFERKRGGAAQEQPQGRPANAPDGRGGAALNEDDRTLIAEAAQIGLSEIKGGEVALERSSEPSVRRLAQALVVDHRQSHARLLEIADRGLVAVAGLDATRAHMITELQETPAAGFDSVYVRTVVRGHMDAQVSLERILTSSENEDLKAYARTATAMVKRHLESAKALEARQLKALSDAAGQEPSL